MTTPSKEAPGELAVVRAFVNTLEIEEGTDVLADPTKLAAWLKEHGLLTTPAAAAGPADLRAGRRPTRGAARAAAQQQRRTAGGACGSGRPQRHCRARRAASAGRCGRSGPARGGGRGRRRRPRPSPRDRLPGHGVWRLVAPQGVPQRHLPVGLLRPLQEPVAALVLDGSLWQPPQGARIPGTAQGGEGYTRPQAHHYHMRLGETVT